MDDDYDWDSSFDSIGVAKCGRCGAKLPLGFIIKAHLNYIQCINISLVGDAVKLLNFNNFKVIFAKDNTSPGGSQLLLFNTILLKIINNDNQIWKPSISTR